MADETQKPEKKEVKIAVPAGAPNIIVLAVIMIVGSLLSSFMTAKMMTPKVERKGTAAMAAETAVAVAATAVAAAEAETSKAEAKAGKEGEAEGAKKTKLVKVGEFIVNLANKETTRYLKTEITLEEEVYEETGGKKEKKEEGKHEGKKEGGELGESEVKIRDVVIEKLSSHTSQDLSTNEGKKVLKEELIKAIQEAAPELKIVNIYFNTFMMQ